MTRVFSAPIIGQSAASGAQVIDGSLNINGNKSVSLTRTVGSGNQTKWTWSAWVKTDPNPVNSSGGFAPMFFAGAYNTSGQQTHIAFGGSGGTSGQLLFSHYSGSYTTNLRSSRRFRDIGWYHIVVVFDSTNSTSGDRARVYVNGERVTSWSSETYPSYGGTTWINDSTKFHGIGKDDKSATENCFNGLMSNVYFIDALALDASYFGFTDPLTNTWRPKKYTGIFNAAAIGSGVVYSANNTGNTNSGYGWDQGFNGEGPGAAGGYVETSNGSTGTTLTLNVPFTTIEFAGNGSGFEFNGTGVSIDSAYAFKDISSSISSPLTSIKITQSSVLSAVRVDGVILADGSPAGVNGFYLPMDGNSPIGQDQSGIGNNWTPVNFGGSNSLEKATGALPILNTTPGGTQSGVGVFGSKENKYYTLTGSTGSGTGYVFENEGTKPTLSMIRGVTYTFDYSAASSHPFRFATAADAAGSTEYTTGTSISGNVISFTVPYNAPDTLYYYCTNHSGMGNSISVTTDTTKADQYASNCVLALPYVGVANDVSNQINATSATKDATISGDAVASSAYSNFYNGSWYFDGSGDYISYGTSSDMDFGSGDCTVECWLYIDSHASDKTIIGSWEGNISWQLSYGADAGGDEFGFSMYDGSTTTASSDAQSTGYVDRWVHVCGQRTGNTLQILVNGRLAGTASFSGSHNALNSAIRVGGRSGGNQITGYVQDVRIYKGVAKYSVTSVGDIAFIPASTSPDILPDTPSGVSVSTKLTKIIDGAVSFDGSGSYLTVPQSDDYDFTGDYTYEAFIYYTDTSGNPTIFDFSAAASNYEGRLQIQAGILKIYDGSWQSRGAISANTWHHIAVTQAKVYVDGIDVGASSGSVSGSNYKKPTIGARTNDAGNSYGDFFTGQISNVRIVNGTALYSSNFTPPSNPLTNVTNTKLLCCQSGTNVQTAAISSQTDSYSAGVYLTAPTYTDRGNSSCTVNNSGSVTSSSAGTNSFGLTNGAAMTGTQKVEIILGNHTPYFFMKAWTLEFYFKTDSVAEQQFIGTLTDGSSWRTGWALDVTAGALKWDYDDLDPGEGKKDLGITISADTWYFCRVQRTPSSPKATAGNLFVEVYDSPTNLVGSFEGVVGDDELHTNNGLKIGDVNDNSSNLTGNWLFANVMITSGYHRRGTVPTLSSGQRAVSTIAGYVSFAASNTGASTFNSFNTDINTVRGQETGYATLNPLFYKTDSLVLSDGNLTAEAAGSNGSGNWKGAASTFAQTSGKWFAEFTLVSKGGANHANIGINPPRKTDAGINHYAGDTGHFYTSNGKFWNADTESGAIADAYVAGDVIGITVDFDASEIKWYRNNVLQNTVSLNSNILASGFVWALSCYTTSTVACNFGQKPFKFPPPDGFKIMSLANTLPENVIVRPDKFVTPVLWTGNSTDNRQINTGFRPDFVWTKRRDSSLDHIMWDSVRGANSELYSNQTYAAGTATNKFGEFNDNGFTIKNNNSINQSGNWVAWCWKAGGNKGTWNKDGEAHASAADAGLTGITSPATLVGASIGTKQGFSIIRWNRGADHPTWTTGLIPHGLTQAPDMIITKNLGSGHGWMVFHSGKGTGRIYLNETGNGDGSGYTALPSATHFTIDSTSDGDSSDDCISYIWHNVPGLQKFGRYDANQNADGPFIDLGFRPALVWIKGIGSGATSWRVFDKERSPINTSTTLYLRPNTDNGDLDDTRPIDIVSNGFKIRVTSGGDINLSSGSYQYVYAAWAEAPSANLFGGQSNAR